MKYLYEEEVNYLDTRISTSTPIYEEIKVPNSIIFAISLSPNGNYLAVASNNWNEYKSEIYIYDLHTRKIINRIDVGYLLYNVVSSGPGEDTCYQCDGSIAINDLGKVVAISEYDGRIHLWDGLSGKLISENYLRGYQWGYGYCQIYFSKDNSVFGVLFEKWYLRGLYRTSDGQSLNYVEQGALKISSFNWWNWESDTPIGVAVYAQSKNKKYSLRFPGGKSLKLLQIESNGNKDYLDIPITSIMGSRVLMSELHPQLYAAFTNDSSKLTILSFYTNNPNKILMGEEGSDNRMVVDIWNIISKKKISSFDYEITNGIIATDREDGKAFAFTSTVGTIRVVEIDNITDE